MPTATADRAQGYSATDWPAMNQPKLDEMQTVYAKLVKDGQGVGRASMYVVAHYHSGDRRYPAQGYETTGDDGIASVSFAVFDAGSEYPVSVDVYLLYDGITLQEGTSYTPTC